MITTFTRSVDQNKLYGRVVKASATLTLLARENEFQFDGFTIIRNRDITSAVTTDANRYCAKLMKRERTWPPIPRFVRRIDLTSWATALATIKSEVVILENERKGLFNIGPIVQLGNASVKQRHFDAMGAWQGLETIRHREITCCTFMDRYSSTHAKYLEWAE